MAKGGQLGLKESVKFVLDGRPKNQLRRQQGNSAWSLVALEEAPHKGKVR